MMRRLAILAACYWAVVSSLLFIDLLGDCGAGGQPELRCPPARAHFELAALMAVALFILATVWVAFQSAPKQPRMGPAAVGCLGALLFVLGYFAIGWWIHSGWP
jgi:hypothetical protein